MVRSILWCLWVGHTSLKKVFRSSWFVCWTFKSPDLAQKGFLETFSDCGLKGNYWNCFHFSQIRQACFLVKNDHFSLTIYRLPGLQKHACESKSVSRILRTCFKPIHVFLCEFPTLHHTICCGPIKSCDFFFFFRKGGKQVGAGTAHFPTFSVCTVSWKNTAVEGWTAWSSAVVSTASEPAQILGQNSLSLAGQCLALQTGAYLPERLLCSACSVRASSLKPSRFLSFWLYRRIFLASENRREILQMTKAKLVQAFKRQSRRRSGDSRESCSGQK